MLRKRIALTLLFVTIALPFLAMAQTEEDLVTIIDAVLPAMIIIGGYLSAKFPIFNRIDDGVYRVLAFTVALGILAVVFGFASVWEVALSYVISTSLYEVILRKIFGSSPKPE